MRSASSCSGALSISTYASIGEIARDEWDAIAGDDVPSSHGWLTTVERTARAELRPVYVLLRAGSRTVAAAACYEAIRSGPSAGLDARLFGRVRHLASRLGLSFLPALVCGPPGGAGGHPLVALDAEGEVRRRLLDALVAGVEEVAARRDLPVCFVDVAGRRCDLVSILETRGYLASVDLPFNVLDLTWDSFDGYLRHLDGVTRGARKDVRRHVNQNRKRGTEIVILDDPAPVGARLHALVEANERAHNRRPFAFGGPFFSVLKAALGTDAVVYAAVKHGQICGVSVLLCRGAAGFLPMVGVDHEATGRDFTFFNLAHYRPIADAIAGGLRRIHLGRALYELKHRRGCRLEPALVFFRPVRPRSRIAVRLWFFVLSAWNSAKVGRVARRGLERSESLRSANTAAATARASSSAAAGRCRWARCRASRES